MTYQDLELNAVSTFLNELSLDEIIQCGFAIRSQSASSFQLNEYVDEGEFSVAGTTSGEGSDSEDLQDQSVTTTCQTARSKRLKTETQRELQRSYDRKFRTNKRARRIAGCETFISALQDLTVMMHFRLARTENEINLLCLAKKKGYGIPTENKAQQQLERNDGVIQCIQSCTSSWRQKKSGELGKYFLRDQAKKIQRFVDDLIDLKEQLSAVTAELRWRVEEKTTGVWV
ncbi:unnamed protein product [Peronospora farinosa]|uniref:BZIP domain-containing protein n=1 Tax=Peronospora farinosa TaxID=134698 RepID=A0AAV0UU12_9STRA|nr:unnamed protein product [Peronospora farinosa]CAI5739977.1 unnamed protein product [Peronospora farinosa]